MKRRIGKLTRSWTAVALSAALMTLSAGTAIAASPDTFSGGDGRIVFASDRSGTALELYSMKANGSDVIQLTHSPDGTGNVYPDWSPDGRHITFASDRSDPGVGQHQIYVMRADGSDIRQLTNTIDQFNLDPAFSPDGRQIAFDRCFSDGCAVWIMHSDGSHQKALTGHMISSSFGPQFSPDGMTIAFIGRPHRPPFWKSAVYVMATDGSNPVRVTPWALQAGDPDWSPVGGRILFESNAVVAHSSLFTIRPDRSGLTQLTDPPSKRNDYTATYAPQGDRIVFGSDRSGYPDIWVMKSDGSNLHDVTPNTPNSVEIMPDWGAQVRP